MKGNNYLDDCLDYMGLSIEEYNDIVDSFRPKHLWRKRFGKWELKNPIWRK